VTSFDVRNGVEMGTVAVVEELMQIAAISIHCVRGETPLVDESPQIGADRGLGPGRQFRNLHMERLLHRILLRR
jgi:hypothetical protein